jgi:hypothetical protein
LAVFSQSYTPDLDIAWTRGGVGGTFIVIESCENDVLNLAVTDDLDELPRNIALGFDGMPLSLLDESDRSVRE